jgi:seryl-tRNA(Sec) selenium transferase
MDQKIIAAITAAIEAYIAAERTPIRRGTIRRLNRWKMATRGGRAIAVRNPTARADSFRMRPVRRAHW